MHSQYHLLKDRRFLPLFITQFFGAFNDNLMKSFIVVMVAYGSWDAGDMRPEVLVSLAAGLFILPFVLFCPLAGELTDRYDKSLVIRITKITEIAVVCLAVVAILLQSTFLAFVMLFALGAQSAFFSPGKFSILPQHLRPNELIAANGLISSGTYLAILFGAIVGTLFALKSYGAPLVSVILIISALIGYFASRKIPLAPSTLPSDAPKAKLHYNPFSAAFSSIHHAYAQKQGILIAILGISWFYFVASTIHAQLPNFAKQTLGVNTDVLSFFMVIFSLGIAIGGVLNNRLLQARLDPKYVPWAALVIGVLCFDLYLSSGVFAPTRQHAELIGIAGFFGQAGALRIVFDLFFLSFFGGLYVVPLRAIVQHRTPQGETARVVAANSLTDSLCILLSSLIAAFLLSLGWSVQSLFIVLSLLTGLVTIYYFARKPFALRS